MFVDEINVFAKAGDGGKGCVAFHREAFVPKGGPSGGNGGRGGDVILEADHDLNNLIAQFYNPRLIAQKGEGGLGKGMDGRAGKDLVLKVPPGTLVWRLPSDSSELPEPPEEAGPAQLSYQGNARRAKLQVSASIPAPLDGTGAELVADLVEHGQRHLLCKGGRGGLGNRNFATAHHQTPRFAQPGEPGAEGHFRFELRLIADVALVGYPNAGKSTLLGAISHARPKVAPYPFTTLTPQVGIVEYPDWKRITVCDIPGLIEGAHRNVGLGHAFLRHLQRCKAIAVVVDIAGTEGRDPREDYRQVLNELELFDPALVTRPRFVVANKIDEPDAEKKLKQFKRRFPRIKVFPVAAAFDVGTDALKLALREKLETLEQAPRAGRSAR